MSIDFNADGRLTLFAFSSTDGKLSIVSQVIENSTEWQYFWTEIGSGLKSFAVAQDLTP